MRSFGFLLLSSMTFVGCLEQYDPSQFISQIREEERLANRPTARLTKDGKIPAADAQVLTTDQVYKSTCSSCHGINGDAKTAQADSLASTVGARPRNFTDKVWQKSVTDDHIEQVILHGGSGSEAQPPKVQGINPSMVAWKNIVGEEMAKKLVQKVRSFGS